MKSKDEKEDLYQSLSDLESALLLEALDAYFKSRETPEDSNLAANADAAFLRAKFIVELKLLLGQELALEGRPPRLATPPPVTSSVATEAAPA